MTPSHASGSSQEVASVSLETFEAVQVHCNLSNEKVYQIGSVLRSSLGKKSVESNLKNHMQAQGKKLKDFFGVEYLSFERTNEEGKIYETQVPTVLCLNLKEFITYVKNERNMSYETENRIGIDGGGGTWLMSSLHLCTFEKITSVCLHFLRNMIAVCLQCYCMNIFFFQKMT